MDYCKLNDIPLFREIAETDFAAMLGCVGSTVKTFSKNDTIFMEQVKTVGVILSGTVQMIKEDIWGKRTILAHLKKGDIFGESFIFGGAECSSI